MGVHKRKGVVYLDVHKLPERPQTEVDRRRCFSFFPTFFQVTVQVSSSYLCGFSLSYNIYSEVWDFSASIQGCVCCQRSYAVLWS